MRSRGVIQLLIAHQPLRRGERDRADLLHEIECVLRGKRKRCDRISWREWVVSGKKGRSWKWGALRLEIQLRDMKNSIDMLSVQSFFWFFLEGYTGGPETSVFPVFLP